MEKPHAVFELLEKYSIAWSPEKVESLGNNGGYSGAQLWRVNSSDSKAYCLRCWPANESLSHIQFVHRVLFHAENEGFDSSVLPKPIPTRRGDFVVSDAAGNKYDLCYWLKGNADFESNPSLLRVQKAGQTLARFHKSTMGIEPNRRHSGLLPGIKKRMGFIEVLNGGLFDRIRNANGPVAFGDIQERLCQHFAQLRRTIWGELANVSRYPFAQQLCIKDIWHDHLLFEGDQLTGIVDFGAIGFDNVATDIARLFGSLFQNDRNQWESGLKAYKSVRELSDAELELIEVYDRSTTMLAGMNWLKWILVENRKFESIVPIIKRMEVLSNRLQAWI